MTKQHPKLGFSLIELSIVILVIGILVIGITKGSRIMSEAKLKSARSLTTSSPVPLFGDLALWLETTSTTSFDDTEEVVGGTISNWYDINPQTNSPLNFSQSSSSSRPAYIKDYTNGLPALKFDGTDDFVRRTNVIGSDLTKTGDQITIFIVQKYNGSAHSSSAIYWGNVTNNRMSSVNYNGRSASTIMAAFSIIPHHLLSS